MKKFKTILFDITKKCNLRCKHCYNSSNVTDDNVEDDINIDRTIQYINKNKDNIKRVHILGGEPLLSDNILYFVDEIDPSINVSINTNGLLLKDNIYKIIEREKIDQLTISIDGTNQEINDIIRGRGTWKQIVENIKFSNKILSKTKSTLMMNLAYVVTSINLDDLLNLPRFIKFLDIKTALVSVLYLDGRAKENEFLYNYNQIVLLNNIIETIYRANHYNVEVIFDLKPIYRDLVEIYSGGKIKFKLVEGDVCNSKDKKIEYISNKNKVFPCGPSSTFEDKYLICDLNLQQKTNFSQLEIKTGMNCLGCAYRFQCEQCPLEIQSKSFHMCDFALEIFKNLKYNIMYNKIRLCKNTIYEQKEGGCYFIQIKDKIIIKIEKLVFEEGVTLQKMIQKASIKYTPYDIHHIIKNINIALLQGLLEFSNV